jgi:hypothetical protein
VVVRTLFQFYRRVIRQLTVVSSVQVSMEEVEVEEVWWLRTRSVIMKTAAKFVVDRWQVEK